MTKNYWCLLIILVSLAGCGTAPKTAGEFREAVAKGTMGHDRETFTANRSSIEIGKTFQAKIKECLNVEVNRQFNVSYNGAQSSSAVRMIYRPKVVLSKDRAEMHVRMQVRGDKVVKLQDEPEEGYFVLVADVSPMGANQSEVNVFYSSVRAKVLLEAVRGWATGSNMACPDVALDAR